MEQVFLYRGNGVRRIRKGKRVIPQEKGEEKNKARFFSKRLNAQQLGEAERYHKNVRKGWGLSQPVRAVRSREKKMREVRLNERSLLGGLYR